MSKLARVADIPAHGDNDTLPFDIDNRFVQVRIGHDFALLAAAVNLARLAKLHTTAAPA